MSEKIGKELGMTKKAKANENDPEAEILKARDEVLRAAITSIEKADIAGSGARFRANFVRSIHEVIEHEGRHMTVLAIKNPGLSHKEKAESSFRMAVAQVYLAALVGLIISGNAQWDDETLLPAQFKNMLHNVMSRARAMDLESGDIAEFAKG